MKALSLVNILLLFAVPANAAYKEVAVNDSGSITGTVKFEGTAPAPTTITINKDIEECGAERVVDEVAIDGQGNLAGAVVFLQKIKSGKAWPASTAPDVIDQKKCYFLPSSRVMRKGSNMRLVNSDSVFHNIHSYEVNGRVIKTMFNVAQPGNTEMRKVVSTKKGNVIKLQCDAHAFMREHILMLEHPYFAETDKAGNFKITDVPKGSYKLMAWHPLLGMQKAKKRTKVKVKGTSKQNFVFNR